MYCYEDDDGFGKLKIKKIVKAPAKLVGKVQKVASKPLVKASSKVSFLKPLAKVQTKTDSVVQKLLTKGAEAPIDAGTKIAKSIVSVAQVPAKKLAEKSPMAASLLMPVETMMLKKKESSNVSVSSPAEQEVSNQIVEDGPLVDVYAADGSQAQVPSNYLTFGKYTEEDGTVWSTTPPSEQTTVQKIAEALSPSVQSASASENLPAPVNMSPDLSVQKTEEVTEEVIEEEGEEAMDQDQQNTGFSLQAFFRKIAAALQTHSNGAEMQGLGEETNMLDTLNANVSKIQQLQTVGKSYGSAFRSIKRKVLPKKEASEVSTEVVAVAPSQGSLGIPPAVIYGGAAVGLGGLVIAIMKSRSKKR